MRIGIKSPNEFFQRLNEINDKIQQEFFNKITDLTKTSNVQVMLGDATVIEQKTFDPVAIQDFFVKITKNLDGWKVQDVTITNNEDIRRIFTKFEIKIGNYLLSGHLSIQFHVLLYYKPLQRVIDCQKELSEVIEQTKLKESNLSDASDQFVFDKLKEMGYDDLDHQKLFEVFFENDKLREKIYSEIEDDMDNDFRQLSKRKTELFNELDSFLVEIYQTSPVLIDDARLVTGEEGCLCTFDLEYVKKHSKEGLFDPSKIPKEIQNKIIDRLTSVLKIMKL